MDPISKIISNRFVFLAIRIVLGVVFIWASIDKIAHPAGFAEAIYNYRMLPYWTINLMAIMMPWLELFCGILLIVGVLWRGSAFMIGVLLAVFIVALSSALIRGLDISCGCFTVDGGHGVAVDLLVRDILMIIGVGILLANPKGQLVLIDRD